ncbi:MAG TPA: hypothetical protein VLH39_08125, partial [Magnetospirillaceae bacterium]|nr:hypothetical protein [Magnetospirillaceae bacterium]
LHYPDPYTDSAGILRLHSAWRPALTREGGMDGSAVALGAQASFPGFLEAAVQGAFDPDSGDSWSFGAGVKGAVVRSGRLRVAGYASLALGSFPDPRDPVPPIPARLGLTAALGSARAYGGLALELEVPDWEERVPRLAVRAGLALAGGRFAMGVSAVARSGPLDVGLAPEGPLMAALEARAFLAPLPMAVGLSLSADFDAGGPAVLRPGLEISLAF